MNRRTAIKTVIASIFAPKVLVDAVASTPQAITNKNLLTLDICRLSYPTLLAEQLVSVQPIDAEANIIVIQKKTFLQKIKNFTKYKHAKKIH